MMPSLMPQNFVTQALNGWTAASYGDLYGAQNFYRKASHIINGNGVEFGRRACLLRHFQGSSEDIETVQPIPATETAASLIFLHGMCAEAEHDDPDLKPIALCHETIKSNILRLIAEFDSGIHALNIKEPREHVMVMSTGRAGTMSLHKLFQTSPNLTSYHSYWWHTQVTSRWWMLASLMDGFGWRKPGMEWAATRAAEWLGPKPMIGCNHMDSIYCPVFAAIHPKAKFVYIYRNPIDVFKSFYGKDQWHDNQLLPFVYKHFEGYFEYGIPELDKIMKIAWFVRCTEILAEAMKDALGDRVMFIKAERLFAQDEEEISKLLDFTNAGIPIEKAKEHYTHKINEKADRATDIPILAYDSFANWYKFFGGELP